MFNVYCDGACLHNQKSRGNGGYGYVIVHEGNGVYENNGSMRNKTSNEMELIAAIAAIKDWFESRTDTQQVFRRGPFGRWGRR